MKALRRNNSEHTRGEGDPLEGGTECVEDTKASKGKVMNLISVDVDQGMFIFDLSPIVVTDD